MSTIILFVLLFGVIVLAHELGHYLIGRKNGITVTDFFIGMGPTLFSFTRKGTKFSLKLLPLGGACIFEGEVGNEALVKGGRDEEERWVNDEQQVTDDNKELSPGSFLRATPLARALTIAGGSLFNFILAYIIGLVIVANTGIDLPIVGAVTPGGQAEAAGIVAGDVIKRINNERIDVYRQIFFISYTNRGETLVITYERGGETHVTTVNPAYDEELGRYLIGVNAVGNYAKSEGIEILRDAYYEVKFGFVSTIKSLMMAFQGRLGLDDVAGPLGIATIVGDTYEMARPHGALVVVMSLLNIAMLLSVNLAIINLLPFPALDGGRLLFILIEVVRGKPVPPEREGLVHLVGMSALILLMVIMLYNDLMRIFT
ncbi:MAG: RIP metalloprotease [Lachnospiraceae bacterium]|jgi:regulator of sigma E protease|nr:RIP metalloprotease [Lachnospiraceae bacterium]